MATAQQHAWCVDLDMLCWEWEVWDHAVHMHVELALWESATHRQLHVWHVLAAHTQAQGRGQTTPPVGGCVWHTSVHQAPAMWTAMHRHRVWRVGQGHMWHRAAQERVGCTTAQQAQQTRI